MNVNKRDTHSVWVDPDDAPELDNDFFEHADLYDGDKLIRRGRPRLDAPREALTVRYSPEVLAAFRATGKGWQSRMNAALVDWLKTHSPTEAA